MDLQVGSIMENTWTTNIVMRCPVTLNESYRIIISDPLAYHFITKFEKKLQ